MHNCIYLERKTQYTLLLIALIYEYLKSKYSSYLFSGSYGKKFGPNPIHLPSSKAASQPRVHTHVASNEAEAEVSFFAQSSLAGLADNISNDGMWALSYHFKKTHSVLSLLKITSSNGICRGELWRTIVSVLKAKDSRP